MSTPFQNRLVGTIIIAAVVIIFLPDVLDGEKQSYQAEFEKIPSAPAFVPKQSEQTFPVEKLDDLPKEAVSNESALDDENSLVAIENNKDDIKVVTLAKEKEVSPQTKVQITPVEKVTTPSANKQPEKAEVSTAWVIHLGSFRHKQNVNDLLNKLKKNGYTAFTRPIKTKNGMLTKVFIGPELIKSSLEKKLPKLKELTTVQGKVALYEPNK